MPNERLERILDVFIFICYTGISYADLCRLNRENISKNNDGKEWLTYHRLKTNGKPSHKLRKNTA